MHPFELHPENGRLQGYPDVPQMVPQDDLETTCRHNCPFLDSIKPQVPHRYVYTLNGLHS